MISLRDNIVEITNLFFSGNIVYLIFTVVCFVILFLERKKLKRGHQLFLAFSLTILVFFLYNPLIFKLFFHISEDSVLVFSRLWLMCPIWLIIAYVISSNVQEIKGKIAKLTIFIIISAIFIITGNSVDTLSQMHDSNNIYKIDDESIALADTVLEINSDEPTSVLLFLHPDEWDSRFVPDGNTFGGLMQYTSKIEFYRYGCDESFWYNYFISDTIPDGYGTTSASYVRFVITSYYDIYGFDYVAMPNDERIIEKMEYNGYELAGRTENHLIFRVS